MKTHRQALGIESNKNKELRNISDSDNTSQKQLKEKIKKTKENENN